MRRVQKLGHALLDALQAMDAECSTGLCDYNTFLPMHSHERACCEGLRRRLRKLSYSPDAGERPYPGPTPKRGRGKSCDLFVLSDADRIWVEVKIVWRQWYYGVLKRNPDGIYKPYFHGPKSGGWEKTHSVAQDMEKP